MWQQQDILVTRPCTAKYVAVAMLPLETALTHSARRRATRSPAQHVMQLHACQAFIAVCTSSLTLNVWL
jgi:hypothetical protein